MDHSRFTAHLHCFPALLLVHCLKVSLQQSLQVSGRPHMCAVLLLMRVLFLISLLICSSVRFQLPDLKVDTEVSLDQSQQVHDSLVNSSIQSFEFHLNLSTFTLGLSALILILFVFVARRQNSSISEIGRRVYQQELNLKKLASKQHI